MYILILHIIVGIIFLNYHLGQNGPTEPNDPTDPNDPNDPNDPTDPNDQLAKHIPPEYVLHHKCPRFL